jgi:hypothetical protein
LECIFKLCLLHNIYVRHQYMLHYLFLYRHMYYVSLMYILECSSLLYRLHLNKRFQDKIT